MSFNGNLQPASDEGTDLTTKGDIHGYSTDNVRGPVGTNDHVLTADSTNSFGIAYKDVGTLSGSKQSFIVAASDETTDLTTGDDKVQFRMPFAFTVTEVRASVNTAPTGAAISVQIQESGSDILSTPITIDVSETTSETAATPPVISDSSLADNAIIAIDLDAVGSTVAGTGLKIAIIGNRT